MQLRAWRKLKSISRSDIAKALETAEATVFRHERGQRCPPPKMQDRYLDLTEGAVTPQDWFELAKDPRLGRDPEEVAT